MKTIFQSSVLSKAAIFRAKIIIFLVLEKQKRFAPMSRAIFRML
jgi:hypothetical protein